MVCDCKPFSVNWSKKIFDCYSRSKNENLKNIVISIQTKSEKDIEPAFIVGEDYVFLDINIIDNSTGMLKSSVVCKNQIQSITFLGYREINKDESKEWDFEEELLDIIESIPKEYLISVKEKTLNGNDL